MNYSTFKKAIVFSLVAALGLTEVSFAQSATSSSAEVFGGRSQYRTWNLGINAGLLAPVVVIGGSNDFTNWSTSLGYGATLRKQLGHSFGLELGFLGGQLSQNNDGTAINLGYGPREEVTTKLAWSGSIMGVANVATIDFLRRENSVNFLVKAGYGLAGYHWKEVTPGPTPPKGSYGPDKDRNNIHGQFIPVGAGVKFKLSDRVNFDLGYNMYFLDGDNLDATP